MQRDISNSSGGKSNRPKSGGQFNMLLLALAPTFILFTSNKFAEVALLNTSLQVVLFLFAAHIPALLTNRMSYVDIAWPWGLVTLGVLPFIYPSHDTLRASLVGIAFFMAGFRMGLGSLVHTWNGGMKRDYPRYLYQYARWERRGITDRDSLRFKLEMHKDIFIQCVANFGGLCTPLFLQAFGYLDGPLTWLEIVGWTMWLSALAFEHTADKQKLDFILGCKKSGERNKVCEVGLWRYSRHPNYFGEWMVWNSLVLTSIPSLMALWQTEQESLITKLGLTFALFSVSHMMYNCLVHWTGAKPAEFYSAQKRPDYKRYQQQVNMFFPGPRKF